MKTLRPSHEINLKSMIHLSNAGPGGLYGYVSAKPNVIEMKDRDFRLGIYASTYCPKTTLYFFTNPTTSR